MIKTVCLWRLPIQCNSHKRNTLEEGAFSFLPEFFTEPGNFHEFLGYETAFIPSILASETSIIGTHGFLVNHFHVKGPTSKSMPKIALRCSRDLRIWPPSVPDMIWTKFPHMRALCHRKRSTCSRLKERRSWRRCRAYSRFRTKNQGCVTFIPACIAVQWTHLVAPTSAVCGKSGGEGLV